MMTLSQDLGPGKTTEAVTKLVEYLRRVQTAQADLLKKADVSIRVQTSLNAVFKKLVPSLEAIQRSLEERRGQGLESGDLGRLCADLQAKIGLLDDLEAELSRTKTQNCEDLRSLVQTIVKVLDRLLKTNDLAVVNDDDEAKDDEAKKTGELLSGSERSGRKRPPQPGSGRGRGGGGKTRGRPPHSSSRGRPAATSSSAPSRSRAKRPKVNYNEDSSMTSGDEGVDQTEDSNVEEVIKGPEVNQRSSLTQPKVRIKRMEIGTVEDEDDEDRHSTESNAS